MFRELLVILRLFGTESYRNWDYRQPNNGYGGQDCTEMNMDIEGLWNDMNCLEKRVYVCKIGEISKFIFLFCCSLKMHNQLVKQSAEFLFSQEIFWSNCSKLKEYSNTYWSSCRHKEHLVCVSKWFRQRWLSDRRNTMQKPENSFWKNETGCNHQCHHTFCWVWMLGTESVIIHNSLWRQNSKTDVQWVFLQELIKGMVWLIDFKSMPISLAFFLIFHFLWTLFEENTKQKQLSGFFVPHYLSHKLLFCRMPAGHSTTLLPVHLWENNCNKSTSCVPKWRRQSC